jgi:hypothetical protein
MNKSTETCHLKTIGNATLVAYEKTCILATDPWFGEEDDAYFGSWNLSHKIPAQIKKDIHNAEFIWFSHGHPDHLNPSSIERFKSNKILLPDHVGNRIKDGLEQKGFDVGILPDRKWINLSKKIRVFCITTVTQNAILLVDINGYLFVNINDAGDKGCAQVIKKISKNYRKKFLLSLSGYGDADMINFFEENGNFIEPIALRNTHVGDDLSLRAKALGLNSVIPFSSFHIYQRTDSIWANKYTTPIDAYTNKFHENLEYISPFAIVNCSNGEINQIKVEKNSIEHLDPIVFGDDWSEELNKKDIEKIRYYFSRKEKVNQFISFLNFRVGNKDNFIKLRGQKNKGITFEVPRNSLMKAVNYEIFDDLLIGNFMKTTLHNMRSLYEGDFDYYVTKYADNGRAESIEELEEYFKIYNKRIGKERFYEMFLSSSKDFAKRLLPYNYEHPAYKVAKKIYFFLK